MDLFQQKLTLPLDPQFFPLLVIGPAYSGKSQWATKCLGAAKSRLILRTAPESQNSFAASFHSKPHEASPHTAAQTNITLAGMDLTAALMACLESADQIIIDSLNQWIGLLIVEEGSKGKAAVARRVEEFTTQLSALNLNAPSKSLVIVSSEAGSSPPPSTDHERFFRHILGLTNQRLAEWSKCVIMVQAGLPLALKAP